MELLKPLLLIVAVTSGLALAALTCAAYTKRTDRSFMGGANIINGLWLISPLEKHGIDQGSDNIKLWGRVALLVCVLSGVAALALYN